MFHKHKNQMAALAIAASLSLLPVGGFAQDATHAYPQNQVETLPQASPSPHKSALLIDMSFQDIRRETKAKVSDTRAWVKNQTVSQDIEFLIDDFEQATDRLQDKVSPVGRSIKSFVSDKLPGKTIVQKSDKSFTVFGIILMLAFAFVIFMMNLANPESRLGGRH